MIKSPDQPATVDPTAQALRELFGLAAGGHWSDLAADGIISLDGQRHILFLNRAARELFGVAAGQSARQSALLWTLLDELNLESLVPSDSGQGSQRVVRGVNLQKDGAGVAIEVAASVVWQEGQRVVTLVTRTQSQSGAAQQALYQSQKRQVIGALAGGVAHDFNNILTAVIGNLDLVLSDEDLPPLTREALTRALSSARRGAELNTKLLAFSRQTDAQALPVNLARLIEETVFILRRSIDPRIRLITAPVPEGLWPARVDEGQFMQVLMNLCLNARDAMPRGGDISFSLANRVLTGAEATGPRHTGDFVQVTVADTGHGMAPDVLARLFEPYFTTKEFGRGAGLGLSIANHVVVENGGWLEVESEPERGSRFHVFIPRSRTAAPPVAGAAPPPVAAVLEGNETILLVDDEQPVRTVMNAVLSYRGYQVIEAEDGNQALEKFRAAANTIQLVLLDIRMPQMNGWDTMKQIHELNPRVPVILLSGGSTDSPDDRMPITGAAGILRKPFTGSEVLRAVRGVLDGVKKTG